VSYQVKEEQMLCKKSVLTLLFIFSLSHMSGISAQTIWTKHQSNPILKVGSPGDWNEQGVSWPKVLFIKGEYHMWYDGRDASGWKIGYATSPDGINWTNHENNPVMVPGEEGEWDDTGIGSGTIIYDGEVFKMWYWGYDGNNGRIGYATSTDGLLWNKHEIPVLDIGEEGTWDGEHVEPGSVIFDGGLYHMWYTGIIGGERAIGYATSPDGIAWTKSVNNPVLEKGNPGDWDDARVYCPVVIQNNGIFQMWYAAQHGLYWRTCYATSTDGQSWQKYDYNPVLNVESFGSWCSREIYPYTVVFEDSVYKMWCTSLGERGEYQIGYAMAGMTYHIPADKPTIQAGIDAARDGDGVLVAEDTYYENINFKGKLITVASATFMDGDTSHISRTIIDGSQHQNPDSGSVVYLVSGEDTNSVLCGFTITGGTGTKSYWEGSEMRTGGGISVWYSGAKIIQNHIINNTIDLVQENIYCHGAGMDIVGLEDQTVLIYDNTFYDNNINSWWGGGAGLVMGTAGKIVFERNIVSKNTYNSVNVSGGGGFYIWGEDSYQGSILINSNIIKDNHSSGSSSRGFGWGGGIYIENCNPSIINNIISRNTSGEGGGLYLNKVGNKIYRPLLLNNTIVFNEARFAGGIDNASMFPIIINTILWHNNATNSETEQMSDLMNYAIMRYSCIEGGWQGDQEFTIDMDPIFKDPDKGDFHLTQFSPCVGRGIDTVDINGVRFVAPATDCEGNKRPSIFAADQKVDIGAYESPYSFNLADLKYQNLNMLTTFSLSQNYPNPFNPVTIINYQLPTTNEIELSIYNLLGQKVITLVNEKQSAGSYNIKWDASRFAAGVYYYQLTAGDFQEVKKMVLLK